MVAIWPFLKQFARNKMVWPFFGLFQIYKKTVSFQAYFGKISTKHTTFNDILELI
jgi:hypothetical protein